MSSQSRRPSSALALSGFAVALAALALAAVHHVSARHAQGSGRLGYMLAHLPWAIAASLAFTIAVSAALAFRDWFLRRIERSTAFCFVLIGLVFCAFWLPVLLTSGFVQDDWILLAAAAARQSLTLHPHLAWFALDTVDANFRPMTTVLYVGWMLRAAGLHPVVLGLGNSIATLLTCSVAFRLVREFGYSKAVATAAALLFLSRPLLYTQVAWMSALGDASSILFCAVAVLLTVIAMRAHSTRRAVALHLLAWASFWIAVLSKQSAFVFPGIVAGLLLLRPVSWPRRLAGALAACVAYGAVVLVVFRHGRQMDLGVTPYGIGINADTVLRVFLHVGCFLLPPPVESRQLPGLTHVTEYVLLYGGVLLVGFCGVMLWRHRDWLGTAGNTAPRHTLFAIFAGFLSLSLYMFLPTRGEAYYAGMGAFWFSLALAMVMGNAATSSPSKRKARWPLWLFTALLLTGYADIRLIQAGAAASGSYIWGNYSVAHDRHEERLLQEALRQDPKLNSVVFLDGSTASSYDESMALITMPQVSRIFVYDSATGTFYGNDRGGRRPSDGWPSYTDRGQYAWNEPLPGETMAALSGPDTLWIDVGDNAEAEIIRPPHVSAK